MEKFLVIGLGVSGRSALSFLEQQGKDVITYDDREKTDVTLEGVTTVVVSPGIPKLHFLYKQAIEEGIEVIGEVELACRSILKPVIAVTGTNGKTTVTQLIAHILEQSGRKVRLLGNGGVPLTSEVTEDADIFVLELSSFQLETMHSCVIDAGAILNITPDHLDRHGSMETYAAAKMHLLNCLKPGGVCYMEQKTYERYGKGSKVKTYAGQTHDEENSIVAKALCHEMGISDENIEKASQSFKKPPHRIEFVRKINQIAYYNDSKGTNIDAVISCVKFLKGPIILIAGGVDKGSSYKEWIAPFTGKVKAIMTIGKAAEKIESELKRHFPINRCTDLADAVYMAQKGAKPGDNVVLSPGCSSFDMFKDYAHRGDEFKKCVRSLGQ